MFWEQIRVLLYVAVLTYGIMEGMAELERAVVTAVGNVQHVKQHTGHELKQSLMRGTLLSLLQNEACLYAVQGMMPHFITCWKPVVGFIVAALFRCDCLH